jgi:hypothetical protein
MEEHNSAFFSSFLAVLPYTEYSKHKESEEVIKEGSIMI